MKIRTDFVTNSSSTGNILVLIDNPLLLEILMKYKEMGLFDENKMYFKIGSRTKEEYLQGKTNTPAFFYEDDGIPYYPE